MSNLHIIVTATGTGGGGAAAGTGGGGATAPRRRNSSEARTRGGGAAAAADGTGEAKAAAVEGSGASKPKSTLFQDTINNLQGLVQLLQEKLTRLKKTFKTQFSQQNQSNIFIIDSFNKAIQTLIEIKRPQPSETANALYETLIKLQAVISDSGLDNNSIMPFYSLKTSPDHDTCQFVLEKTQPIQDLIKILVTTSDMARSTAQKNIKKAYYGQIHTEMIVHQRTLMILHRITSIQADIHFASAGLSDTKTKKANLTATLPALKQLQSIENPSDHQTKQLDSKQQTAKAALKRIKSQTDSIGSSLTLAIRLADETITLIQ